MRILSIDYGLARTGLAISDYTQTIATPLAVIHERGFSALIEKIAQVAEENEVGEIVVGNPVHMNGMKSDKSEICEDLAEKLREFVKVPVSLWDERLTTVSARSIVNANNAKKKKRREAVDAVAAAVILEAYLGFKKNQK
jgi:putative Holliday junction resolvase